MRTIGLIGGMSFESSAVYYRQINETVRARLGGLASAEIIMHSVNFEEIVALQKAGRWDQAADRLARAAEGLERAGADCILICTNTMHLVADAISATAPIPLLHIVDVTAAAVRAAGIERVGLLGTRFTMEQGFYRNRMSERHGLRVIVPGAEDRETIHRIIYEELCLGVVTAKSRGEYRRIMESIASQGAQAIILGCTEISLLVGQQDSAVPLFDTTAIHARAAAEEALSP